MLSKSLSSDEMLAELQQLISIFPDKAELHAQAGVLHIQNFNFSKAIAELNIAIELDPDNEKNYRLRALSYHNLNKLNLAIKDYNFSIGKLIRQHQSDKDNKACQKTLAATFNLRAITYTRNGDLHDACQDYSASAKLGSKKGYNNYRRNCNVYNLTR
jgi:Flp pilus assembly protein TadD